jgi:hypothetical protein
MDRPRIPAELRGIAVRPAKPHDRPCSGRRPQSLVGAIGLFGVAAIFVGACGGATKAPVAPAIAPAPAGATAQPRTTAASTSVDSCVAVTQSEAGSALGHAVRAPVRGKATVEGGIACVFYGPNAPQAADPDVPAPDSVRVVLVRGPEAVAFFNDYRGKVPARLVAGLGDQAFYDGSASLSVLKGSAYLRIAVIGVSDVLSAEEKLAQAALPRM